MTRRNRSDSIQIQPAFNHAVVIGSSIAGLTVARVLTDHFKRVTIIERDRLPENPEFRRGVPQARHAHMLPLRGQEILVRLFPGLLDDLAEGGATTITDSSQLAFYIAGGWHELKHRSAVVTTTCSRPLLETAIYRHMATHPTVDIIQEHDVIGLQTDPSGEQVSGVILRSRNDGDAPEIELPAELVVDTSGRDSQAPQWLAALGYTPPNEETVNSFPGYATRIYRRPAGFEGSWHAMMIKPSAPNDTRGGIIIPIEDDRWHVTLVGMARDYPPTDEADFLDFAHSLPVPQLYDAIAQAEPLTKPYGYRRTDNRVRRYEQLPRYLEGFLVCGDAVYALNPVYAQGMTAAALSSQTLDRCLQQQRQRGDLLGMAGNFQAQLSKTENSVWQLAVREDQRWPETEINQAVK